MRNISKILIIFFIIISTIVMAEESLFMSDDDSKRVLAMLKEDKRPVKTNNLKVTGIVFIDDLNWIIWINDKPYNSIGEKGEFSIDEVTENSVIITQNDGKTLTLSVE